MSDFLNWSSDAFADIYNSIKFQNDIDATTTVTKPITNDLIHVLTTPTPSDKSLNTLTNESKPITFPNGTEVKLNQAFIEVSVILANELELDELNSAELLYHSNDVSYKRGTSLGDSARLAYYARQEYILNILGHLISHKRLDSICTSEADYNKLFDNIVKSFEKVYKLILNLNNMIDKQKVTSNINSLAFISSINFSRSQLFSSHELLGSLLFGLMDNYFEKFGKLENYKRIISLISNNVNDDDILVVHFLPGVLQLFTKLMEAVGNDQIVDQFHKHIVSTISTDYSVISNEAETIDLSKSKISGFEVVTSLVFLTQFIYWCKESGNRTAKYDFKENILKYMEWLISYGAMERILCYCAETSHIETQKLFEWSNIYDFRALLQKNFPKLVASKFQYPGGQELLYASNMKPGFENVPRLVDVTFLKLNKDLNETLISPFFQRFFSMFISNAAIILTSLRDSEEDFVLSSINRKEEEDNEKEDNGNESPRKSDKQIGLNLDEVAQRADLERFYLAFAYTCNNRPELCSLFWSDDAFTNDVVGFISWGLANNTSPLITATFCLFLGSLASGGSDAAARIWEILVSNNYTTMKKNDYSKISVDSLVDSLNYYIDSLNESFEQDLNEQLKLVQKKHEFLFTSNPTKQDSEDPSNNRVVIALAEDSVVFVSGFIQLISAIVKNLSASNDRCKEIKQIAYNRFSPIIRGFLKFDNLINGGKILSVDVNFQNANNAKFVDLPNIFVSDESRITLTNLILNLLGDFVNNDDDPYIRYEIWRLLDRWVYHGLHDLPENSPISNQGNDPFGRQITPRKKYISKRNVRINQAFTTNLTHLSQIANFTVLVKRLLTPFHNANQAFTKYSLLYPCDLGFGYRFNNQIGIWPYIEFLMLEVFAKSNDIVNARDREVLQLTIMQLASNSIGEIDWKFLNDVAPNLLREMKNFDSIFDSLTGIQMDYNSFVKSHHSLAVLNYLFENKAFNALFKVVNIGVDAVNASDLCAELLASTLNVIDKLLEIQETFLKRLLPILKNKHTVEPQPQRNTLGINTSMSLILTAPRNIFDSIYLPTNIGSHGVSDFYEVLLFHLSTVAHFALYVGSTNGIANIAVDILQKIDGSKFFRSRQVAHSIDPLLQNNRLLTTFESIDESLKIKHAFIDKFEAFEDDLIIKYKILRFLMANLNQSNGKVATVAHFLLGYEVRGDNLDLDDENKRNVLLRTLLNTLIASLDLITEIDYSNGINHVVDVGPAKLSSLILEILIKLCRDPISSLITLKLLRDYDNFFETLINYQPKLDLSTIWCGNQFNGDLQTEVSNSFIESSLSTQAFFAFINQRSLILQYLSLEFHHIKSITKKEYYIELLIKNRDFLNRALKILSFLDVLNYSFKNFEIHKYESLDKKFNMALILEEVKKSKSEELDLSTLDSVFRIMCQGSSLATPEAKQSFSNEIMVEGNRISEFVTKYLVSDALKEVQLKCLHSWCQLIEILITDSGLKSPDFILEVLNVILPRTNDYLESDMLFSEEMISLCVLLFDLYDKQFLSVTTGEDFALGMERLIPLFQTCVAGILNSNSTPHLRSDLYVLSNKFLMKVFSNDSFLQEMIRIIKSIDKKFVKVICNDAIYSEGPSRITSTLLLESLIHLGSLAKVNFILEALVKNNSLLLLVRSIKRTDQIIKLCTEKNSKITLDNLIFELTAFRATLYLLIRVSQAKNGALQLIQSELFSLLKQSNFLSIDPDLGLNLQIDEYQDYKNIKINVLLDTPLSLTDLMDIKNIRNENTISYFEFLIPIFQLVSTVLLAMGPNYKPGIIQAKELMKNFDRLIVGVMKRELLIENKQIEQGIYKDDSLPLYELKESVKLITLIDSLVNAERQ
ncbi:NUP192 [[Candida] subhashii]|uniref:NUP192 n=1 Tax=[Candida] subhashii TaxID=561895 RepID=A0A8J5UV46_9ASCO|nr:NUP192 [[Candida] subhashii]KAG7662045.1 NUP192 [[Candida] subhashii]